MLAKIGRFYIDGFRQMRLGKTLWTIVTIKIIVLFVVIKWLFFPDILQTRFHSDTQRSQFILEQLTQKGE